ncbi:MAG: flagellar type III secretion system protein FliR [Clostridiaceae bacterium]|nr:flagellar type III secretion system protein FliR [Clostridiaceae bacterium]
MNNLFDIILFNMNLFFLIFFRISGIFIVAPIFSRKNIPMMVKIGLSVLITFILLPIISMDFMFYQITFGELAFYVIKEFLLGIIIGFVGFLYFSTLYLAGTIIDTQIGFAMVNVMDPQTNSQMPIMSSFYNIIFTLLFLAMNGHHLIIRALVYSYNVLPVGFTLSIGEEMVQRLISIMTEIFILSFRFSAPILATIFLANVLLGILARTMPQMNVFIVGLPLKIIVGLTTILITLQFVIPFSERLFDRMFHTLYEVIQILSRG